MEGRHSQPLSFSITNFLDTRNLTRMKIRSMWVSEKSHNALKFFNCEIRSFDNSIRGHCERHLGRHSKQQTKQRKKSKNKNKRQKYLLLLRMKRSFSVSFHACENWISPFKTSLFSSSSCPSYCSFPCRLHLAVCICIFLQFFLHLVFVLCSPLLIQ